MEILSQTNTTFDNKLNDFIKMHDQLSAAKQQPNIRYNKLLKYPLNNNNSPITTHFEQVDGKSQEDQFCLTKEVIRRKIKTLTQTEQFQNKSSSDVPQPEKKSPEINIHKQKDYIIKIVDRSRGASKDSIYNNNSNSSKMQSTPVQSKKDNLNISINSININSPPQDSLNSASNQSNQNQTINNQRVSLYQQMTNRSNYRNLQENNNQKQQNNFLLVQQEEKKSFLTPSPRQSKQTSTNVNSGNHSYMQSIVRTRRFSMNPNSLNATKKLTETKENGYLSTSSSNESSEGENVQTYQCNLRNKVTTASNQPRKSIFQHLQTPLVDKRRRNSILNTNQQIKNRQNNSYDIKVSSENTQNEIDSNNQFYEEEEKHIFSVAYDQYDHSQLEILNNDEQLDVKFLNEFLEINKNYLEDNLQVSLASDKECVDIYPQKTSSIDVMVGIEFPEKNEQIIAPYVDIFRRNQSEQIRKEDLVLQRNQGIPLKTKQFNIKDYVSSPSDLIIVIDVNMCETALQQVLNSIEFIISNSSKNDRISLIIPVGNQILKSNLMRCSTTIKNTLIHVLKKVKPSSRLSNHRAFINALWTVQERKYKNFLTSIFWFSYGQISESLSHQVKEDLLHLNIKCSFSINAFHIKNPKDDLHHSNHLKQDTNFLQELSHSKGGNYYFIESEDQIAQFGAKALGFIKTCVGFKASATIIKCVDTKCDKTTSRFGSTKSSFQYKNELEKKHIYTPIPNLETIYGGDAIWKENSGLHGYSVDQPLMNSGVSKYFNLRYSFQGTNMSIPEDDKEQPIFKAQLFIYHENISSSPKFTFKECLLSLKFRNYNTQNSPQINSNNKVLKTSFLYRLIPEINNYFKLLQNGEELYALKKLEEGLKYIQNVCGPQATIESQNLIKFVNSLMNYASYPEELTANVKYSINSFMQSHVYQKAELFQKKMSFETQLSDHYMNYVQFYLQKLTSSGKQQWM